MPDVWVHTSVVGDFRPDVGRRVCGKFALLWYMVRILRTSDFLLGVGVAILVSFSNVLLKLQ